MSRNTTAEARRTRCSTASVPSSTGVGGTSPAAPPAAGAGHLAHVHAEQRGHLLAQAAHPGAQRLHAQTPAGSAHHRPGLAAPGARQHLGVPRLALGGAATATAGHLAAVTAGQQAGTAGAVVHADQRPAAGRRQGGPGQPDELLGEQPGPRVRPPAVHALERRPPRPLVVARRCQHPNPGAPRECRRRHRRGQDARRPLPMRPLQEHIRRVVRGRALLGVCARRARRAPPPPPGGAPGTTRWPGSRRPGASRPGPRPTKPPRHGRGGAGGPPGVPPNPRPARGRPCCRPGRATAGSSATARTRSSRSVDGGSRTRVAPRQGRGLRQAARERLPPSGAGPGRGWRGQRRHDAPRGGHPEEERGGAGPAPCRPLGQRDHAGGRSPAQPRREGPQRDPGRRRRPVLDDPSPHRAAVQRDAHPGAHAHVPIPRRRHRVVEVLDQRRHLGADAHDPVGRRRVRLRGHGLTGTAPRPRWWSGASSQMLRGRVRSGGRRRGAWPPT